MQPVDNSIHLGQWGMQNLTYQRSYQFGTILLGFRGLINDLSMNLTAENPYYDWRGWTYALSGQEYIGD